MILTHENKTTYPLGNNEPMNFKNIIAIIKSDDKTETELEVPYSTAVQCRF